nr:MAG TPA: hypothetical protein [Caudoviricetes sp.]
MFHLLSDTIIHYFVSLVNTIYTLFCLFLYLILTIYIL